MTETQKRIYNLYLKASRTMQGKPYRPRKNFDKIENDPEMLRHLASIETVFKKYPGFFNIHFFTAPYIIYGREKQIHPLKFYTTHKGISTCIAYFKTLIQSDPANQIDYLKESLKFVAEFCLEKGIPVSRYTEYKSVAQCDCLKHLKEHKISWYLIGIIPELFNTLYHLPSDEFELYYGSEIDLAEIKLRFDQSPETKDKMVQLYKKILLFVDKKLEEKKVLRDK